MLDAAREAVSFVRNRRRGGLGTDRQLVLAVVKAIEIVGEATARVSEAHRLADGAGKPAGLDHPA